MRKYAIFFSLVLILAAPRVVHAQNIKIPMSRNHILKLAGHLGLGDDLRSCLDSENGSVENELAQAKLIGQLWQTEFEIQRVLTEIQEEQDIILSDIDRAENRQAVVANSLDAFNFLSTSILGLVGNCAFIPAPPPRPKLPNILFSAANGISTELSLLSLVTLRDHKTVCHVNNLSMLEPLFDEAFYPNHSGRVWKYLNAADDSGVSARKLLVSSWQNEIGEGLDVVELYKLKQQLVRIKLSRLQFRSKMLDELRTQVSKMSVELSKLGHSF